MKANTQYEHITMIPEIGDEIYVPTALYIEHGEDDVKGGLARIIAVKESISAGKPMPYVQVQEHPGVSYNWERLEPRQETLRQQFGEARAHPDPDLG